MYPRIKRHVIAGDIGVFAGIGAAADGDVGLHLFHAGQFDVAHECGMFFVGVAEEFARDAGMAHFDHRNGAGGARRRA